MEILSAFVIFGAIAGIALFINQHMRKKAQTAFRGVAKTLDLGFLEGGFFEPGTVTGNHQGCQVLITTEIRGTGKQRHRATIAVVSLTPSLDIGLRISEEHVFKKIGKMMGFQDIEVGHAEFDDKFLIKGKDVEAVVALLNHRVRACVLDARNAIGPFEINDREVRWEYRGVYSDTHKLLALIRWQVRLSHLLREAAAKDV